MNLKPLKAYEANGMTLVPVEIRPPSRVTHHSMTDWNKAVRRWHRTQ